MHNGQRYHKQAHLGVKSSMRRGRNSGGRSSLQVDSLNSLAQIIAAADKVAKVLASDFSLGLEFGSLLFLVLEVLDVALETNAHIVCGTLESTSNLRADAKGVLVSVVDSCQLLGQLRAQSMR
jgi:hypothetical protein